MNFALLSPRVWLELLAACVVAAVLWYAYHWAYSNGARDVQASFDAYKTEQIEQAAAQDRANRAKEQVYQNAVQELTDAYIKERQAHSASAAAAAGSLRELEAALGRAAAPGSAATSRTNGAPGLESELLGSCARALVGMAAQADRLEEQVVGLQSYVKNIVLRK